MTSENNYYDLGKHNKVNNFNQKTQTIVNSTLKSLNKLPPQAWFPMFNPYAEKLTQLLVAHAFLSDVRSINQRSLPDTPKTFIPPLRQLFILRCKMKEIFIHTLGKSKGWLSTETFPKIFFSPKSKLPRPPLPTTNS